MSKNEKQTKCVFLVNDMEHFALSHLIFTNQNQVFVSVCSIVKVVNVANYYITIKSLIQTIRFLVNNYSYTTVQLNKLDCLQIQSKVVGLQLYTSTTYKFTYSCIFIFMPPENIYQEIYKLVRYLIRTKWSHLS